MEQLKNVAFFLSNGGIMYIVSITIVNDNIDVTQNLLDEQVKLSCSYFYLYIYLPLFVVSQQSGFFLEIAIAVLMNSPDYQIKVILGSKKGGFQGTGDSQVVKGVPRKHQYIPLIITFQKIYNTWCPRIEVIPVKNLCTLVDMWQSQQQVGRQ